VSAHIVNQLIKSSSGAYHVYVYACGGGWTSAYRQQSVTSTSTLSGVYVSCDALVPSPYLATTCVPLYCVYLHLDAMHPMPRHLACVPRTSRVSCARRLRAPEQLQPHVVVSPRVLIGPAVPWSLLQTRAALGSRPCYGRPSTG